MNVWTINHLLSQSVPIQHSCSSHWSHYMNTTDFLKLRRLIKDLAYKDTESFEWIPLERSQNEFRRLMLFSSQSHWEVKHQRQ